MRGGHPQRQWRSRAILRHRSAGQSGAGEATPLLALPVRAAFGYRKKAGRREYVRVKLTRTADGTIEAVKHAQEGAGIITSLTETDGLVELSEDTTTIAPGSTVGFLSYAALAA